MQKNLSIVKKLSYKGEEIEYHLSFKSQKYIRLKVVDKKIIITAPIQAEDWEIERLIYKNINKITKLISVQAAMFKINEGQGFVKIFGEDKIAYFTKNPTIDQPGYVFKIYETEQETIKKMYKKLSIIHHNNFLKVINNWKAYMNLDFKNLSVKEIKGKWGVCYPDKSKIVLNIRLIHYPIQALEYVVVHELAHLVHKNHSKSFWNYVGSILPNYKNISEILKVGAI
ncbi:zinc metalloprotease [Spiroplasma litorale]|uniref:Zinc metalloprotease n=1 Tax=Spiroplasma litorale TaxID=216942 RepID=A0A0K1W353_9MOLU|nr:YgjP-like metallopeptidase domain-containing protein [Spiroplasma litorale]AKX34527.1 zinc metalloprotease [Spiroplasma litorale]